MKNMNYYKHLYGALLPIPFMTSSIFGAMNGIHYGIDKKDQFQSFSSMVGYTSLGMITGIMYPISFPLLAGYVLLQKSKE
jgi:hypothetical protein